MARSRYRQKPLQYDVVQFTGDLKPLEDMGLKFSHTEWKERHVGIYMNNGYDKACQVGHYVVKSDAGDIEILSPDEFAMKYESV